MKLKSFQVSEFHSVHDSGLIEVDDIVCFVGKNEAGKTALLKALYNLNPLVKEDGNFDVTLDYPRMQVEDYRQEVESGKRDAAQPISATYELDDEKHKISEVFGPECLKSDVYTISKSYENKRFYSLALNETAGIEFLIENADLTETTLKALSGSTNDTKSLLEQLSNQEQSTEVQRLISILQQIAKKGFSKYIFEEFISPAEPRFLYFDEYYQMTGHENIQALQQRKASGTLKSSDYPLLGLISLARLDLAGLLSPDSTISLKNKLEAAGNHLTRQVLRYWSQNKHLRMTFDVRPAHAGDPIGMQQGTNIWGGVFDDRHLVTTELGSRSRGFVWFFSFLSWYSDVKKRGDNVILLLDEPGLTLHAKAQEDLLRYFEQELKPSHQLLYSSHSPFMVDPRHFERVRIVQDKSIETDEELPEEEQGTKVFTDVLEASEDSLFPLQGALGYELHQTLFIGPNSLIVEGPSDLLYIQAVSSVLEQDGREGLNEKWTIMPVGGAGMVPTFVALLARQKGMNLATLIDIQSKDRQVIENLYKKKLLNKSNVLTFADFTGGTEADIEDMFDLDFYLKLVNQEFGKQLSKKLTATDLAVYKKPRTLSKLNDYFANTPMKQGTFSHYRPARYFLSHLEQLSSNLSETTKDRFEEAFSAINKLL